MQLAFSECMRGHGVPDFPDPSGGRRAQPRRGRDLPELVSLSNGERTGQVQIDRQHLISAFQCAGGRRPWQIVSGALEERGSSSMS